MIKKICGFGVVRTSVTIDHAQERLVSEPPFHTTLTALIKHRLEIAFKEVAGILTVLLCIGSGRSDRIKGLIKDRYDALLFLYIRWNKYRFTVNIITIQGRNTCTTSKALKVEMIQEMEYKARFISMKITDVQSGI